MTLQPIVYVAKAFKRRQAVTRRSSG